MKLVHLALTGGWYGTEGMVARMANELVARGHEVALVWRAGPGFARATPRKALDPRVELCVVPRAVLAPRLAAAWIGAWLPWEPDLYHAHLRPDAELATILAAGRVPWVASLHMRFTARDFARSDAVLAVARWQLDDIPASYEGLRFWAPNFHVPFEPAGPSEIGELRRRWGAADGSFVIGSVARLEIEKGLDVLCRAFLEAELPDAHLVIVGEGSERTRLRRLVGTAPNVHLLGYVEDARRLMTAFDLYASAARSEAFGLTLLEAMSLGLPIVSSAALGPAELLRDHPDSLVPVGDVAALRDALKRAYRARERGVSYDTAAYEKDAAMRALLDAYEHTRARFVPKPSERSWLEREAARLGRARSHVT